MPLNKYCEPLSAYKGPFLAKPAIVGHDEPMTSTELATPQGANIPKPNLDTLYMMQLYGISSEDIEVTLGEVPEERF